jgi:hypothetical protein
VTVKVTVEPAVRLPTWIGLEDPVTDLPELEVAV